MRFVRNLLASVAALVMVTASRAAALVQEGAKIEIKTTDSHGAWYTQPVWIAIGVIALVLIILLISMAGRRGNTTVVK